MIWVTGCNGMLGTEICRQLEKNKLAWIGTGSETDITNYEVLEKFFTSKETELYPKYHNQPSLDVDGGKIKWIVNCAAYTNVDKAEEDAENAGKLNSLGPENLARIARAHNAKLIHISTDYVFDGTANSPIPETAQKNPTGIYGKTKSDGEDAIMKSMTQYYILRTAWLYGFDGKNFVYTMTKLFNSHDKIKVVSDQTGTPTFCGNLADAVIKIILRTMKSRSFFGRNGIPAFGIYNFTDEGQTDWFSFAKTIYAMEKKFGITSAECEISPCTTEEYAAPAKRPAYSVLDKTKIQKELKIKIPEWKQSLEFFLKNKKFEPK